MAKDTIKNYAINHGLKCLNPNCSSGGRPHYGCLCYGGGGEGDYAKGGAVCSEECSHNYANGGPVEPQNVTGPSDPSTTLGHAAVNHGLLSLLQNVGNAKLANPEKHHKTIDKIKAHLAADNHDKATGVLHGHPLAGSVGKESLKHMVGSMASSMQSQDSHPEAMRGSMDYLNSAVKGHSALENGMGKMLGKDKLDIESEKGSIDKLKKFLDEVQENPSKLLDVGGNIGHYLPDHAAMLGATAATATQYLTSLKPKQPQAGPLDEPAAPGKMETAHYDRQLEIAEKPTILLRNVKDGTLLPQDVKTVQTIYPALFKSMTDKATEALVEAKTKKKEIPYKQKMALSMLLGQPLDFTQTPQAAMAVVQSGMAGQQPQQSQKEPKKATGVELKQINKTDELGETTLEARQINRNKK